MSMTSLIGVKSRGLVFVLTLVESMVFFAVSAGLFAVAGWLGPPAWVWVIVAILYLGIITVYWVPARDREANSMEVWAFGTALVLACLLVVLCWRQGL